MNDKVKERLKLVFAGVSVGCFVHNCVMELIHTPEILPNILQALCSDIWD